MFFPLDFRLWTFSVNPSANKRKNLEFLFILHIWENLHRVKMVSHYDWGGRSFSCITPSPEWEYFFSFPDHREPSQAKIICCVVGYRCHLFSGMNPVPLKYAWLAEITGAEGFYIIASPCCTPVLLRKIILIPLYQVSPWNPTICFFLSIINSF